MIESLRLFDVPDVRRARHPAPFSLALIPVLAKKVAGATQVLDPFAGTGMIHRLPNRTVGVEIEPEWARQHPDTIVGDALRLPFADETFDAVVTSPTYGNRMADHHVARDGSVRRSYTHDLGRDLHPHNSGALQWGEAYCQFHEQAWREVRRVLRPGGRFVLNVKDHVRAGQVQPVTAWHESTLIELGFVVVERERVASIGMRYGENRERVDYESVVLFESPEVRP